MKLLDSLTIPRGVDTRSIEIWHGDLTEMEPSDAVDWLVVSAPPGSYLPVPGTLMGTLDKKGVSVEQLSRHKAVDLSSTCSCWLSGQVTPREPGIHFERILCFEPVILGSPTQVVGDIFRCLAPFALGQSQLIQVAMPLVSTGTAATVVADMTEALFTAAVHWIENGFGLKRLKIVERSPTKAAEIKGAFAVLKKHYRIPQRKKSISFKYDVCLSYHPANQEEALIFVDELGRAKGDLKIAWNRKDFAPDAAWQEKLYRTLAASRKVVPLYSPNYIRSKVCQEEYNLAHLLHVHGGEKRLLPLALYPVELLPHMLAPALRDLRGDREKMSWICHQLVGEIDPG